VEWLRQRLKHFVAVRTKEIQPEPHLNPKHYYTSSELDYLCWLHLVSPISEQWTLHEISRAVKKMFFFDESYYPFKERWLSKPPSPLRYRVPNKNESPGERLKTMTTPVGFEEAEADWLSGVLAHLRPFSDLLAELLTDTGFRYIKRRGRPPQPCTETPAKTQDIRAILLSDSPLENFAILGKKDLEKDEPKGWLLAKAITV
jgi:hypothetical protein